ncbi:uncharacterized protein K460DRAFT_361206 [Cucurbitaria berberidis CBS 394.84]|uniref:Uncharacterized protein n=1 Tax=Cucurbitaria berberidis CBS 394.84 TaxID=1168544 RepID=A0A9P4LC73_9PLEO|nr:uncharacterized protein K460DRAFT_361206 [Cucurbitaria berberidis CBS 394.84]KAF1850401.1 hypothetical protein K460DRAFT_361206 [Cucurbitaria berberidis CBS 394.84]
MPTSMISIVPTSAVLYMIYPLSYFSAIAYYHETRSPTKAHPANPKPRSCRAHRPSAIVALQKKVGIFMR